MRASSLLYLWLTSGVLSLVLCPAALSCSCSPPSEKLTINDLFKQSVDSADLVFVGVPTVLHGDGKSEDTEDLVTFEAAEVFKGEKTTQVSVHSGVGVTHMLSCGYSFKLGKKYLVFATNYGVFLTVAACSFTAPIEKSEGALRYLRKEPPQPEDLLTPTQIERNASGRILGIVRRSDGVKLRDPEVYIWNDSDPSYEKEAWFTRPEKDGSFESYFLSPGTYRITAVDTGHGPTRWVGCHALDPNDSIPEKVVVMAGRDYDLADIVLREQEVYSIQGTVRTSDDSPLPFKDVEIRASMASTEMFPFLDFIQPRPDGAFYIPRVPVGTAHLKTYVSQYVDPNWEISETDVEVNGDVEKVEIVLTRKAGGASDLSMKKVSSPN